jgi:magnesium transporter
VKRKRQRTQAHKAGLPPGSAVYVGQPRVGGVSLKAFVYDSKGMVEHQHPSPTEVFSHLGPGRVLWVDCDGVHDAELVSELCSKFNVHPLAVEDVLNTSGRPKLDVYENGLVLLSLNMLFAEGAAPNNPELCTEHVTFLHGPGFVLSFQEGRAGDLFDPVRSRIRAGTGKIRSMGADYLLHALVDAIVDGYFVVLDRLEEQVEAVELLAFDDRTQDLPAQIYELKTEHGMVRRAVFPLREMVNRLQKGEAALISRAVEPYLHDLYDHVVSVLDHVDAGRERLTSVLEMHLALATHKMNDVMRVLTVVSTIFIPLSWIAGIYGMNFDHMPELHWFFGYPLAVCIMLGMAGGMLGWFRYKGWF